MRKKLETGTSILCTAASRRHERPAAVTQDCTTYAWHKCGGNTPSLCMTGHFAQRCCWHVAYHHVCLPSWHGTRLASMSLSVLMSTKHECAPSVCRLGDRGGDLALGLNPSWHRDSSLPVHAVVPNPVSTTRARKRLTRGRPPRLFIVAMQPNPGTRIFTLTCLGHASLLPRGSASFPYR